MLKRRGQNEKCGKVTFEKEDFMTNSYQFSELLSRASLGPITCTNYKFLSFACNRQRNNANVSA